MPGKFNFDISSTIHFLHSAQIKTLWLVTNGLSQVGSSYELLSYHSGTVTRCATRNLNGRGHGILFASLNVEEWKTVLSTVLRHIRYCLGVDRGPESGVRDFFNQKRVVSSLNVSHPIEWYSEPTNRMEDPSLLALTSGEWTDIACVLCKRLMVREGSETEDNVKFLAARIIGFFVHVKVIVQYAYTKCIAALCDVL